MRAGTLIDGSGAEPRRDAVLVVEDGRIARIAAEPPRGSEVIDAADLTVLPGLIDCHVHLWMRPQSLEQRVLKPYSLVVAEAFESARITVESGFTSVRDAGGLPRGAQMAIDQGLVPGPRTRISVSALSQTAGHGDGRMPSGVQTRVEDPEHPMTVVDGVDNVRRATRELIRAGAQVIKVHSSGGVMSPNDEPTATGFTPEELAAIVYEATAAGRATMTHSQALQGIKNAVAAGFGSIDHGIYLDEETAHEMKRRGTYLVATLIAPLWVIRRAERDPGSVPPYAVRKAKEVVEVHRRMFEMAVRLGVPIAMGTDTGVGPHGTNAEELALMVECGMTPMQAIVAATRVAAECVRIPDVGTLEPGRWADLIAVRGDPLADIGLLQDRERIAVVMKGGRVIIRR